MPGALPRGVLPQVYLDALHGATHDARMGVLATGLDAIRDAGCPGVLFHGFPASLPARFPEYAALAAARGLLAFAAFGLPGGLPPADAGHAMGTVAARADCAGVFLDAEGAYDTGRKGDAAAMVAALRAVAPGALVADQPWFAPLHHSGFPYEEFAAGVDVRCPQVYLNDFHGPDRYRRVFDWYAREWAQLEASRLTPRGLARPRVPTIQAEGWADIPGDLDACLAANVTVVAWCDKGLPPPTFLAAVRRANTTG